MTDSPSPEARTFVAWLEANGAHHDLTTWARSTGLGLGEAYARCPRGDWALALALRVGVDSRQVEELAVRLSAFVLEEFADPELEDLHNRLRKRFEERELATEVEREAEAAAERSNDLAHALAFRILALAARSLRERDAAALLPGMLGEMTIATVLDCAMASAYADVARRTADAVREAIPPESLAQAFKAGARG